MAVPSWLRHCLLLSLYGWFNGYSVPAFRTKLNISVVSERTEIYVGWGFAPDPSGTAYTPVISGFKGPVGDGKGEWTRKLSYRKDNCEMRPM